MIVRNDFFFGIPGIDGRFENFYLLSGKLGPFQSAYQFFGFVENMDPQITSILPLR